jgi:hypothetical protein
LYSVASHGVSLPVAKLRKNNGSVASSTPAPPGEPFGIIPLKLSNTVYSTWPTITDWSLGTGMLALPIWIDLVAAGLLPAGLSEYEPPPPEQAARNVASAAAPPPITDRRLNWCRTTSATSSNCGRGASFTMWFPSIRVLTGLSSPGTAGRTDVTEATSVSLASGRLSPLETFLGL